MERFPTVEVLASASEEEVNVLWAGLGYYRRAAQIRACAQRLVADFGGTLPHTAEELLTLPGIGRQVVGWVGGWIDMAYRGDIPACSICSRCRCSVVCSGWYVAMFMGGMLLLVLLNSYLWAGCSMVLLPLHRFYIRISILLACSCLIWI